MTTLESLLSIHSRVELLEYEAVAGAHVRLVLLGYPKQEDDEQKGNIYRLILKTPKSIVFHSLNVPTQQLTSVKSDMTADGVTVSIEFADRALIKVHCAELVWV